MEYPQRTLKRHGINAFLQVVIFIALLCLGYLWILRFICSATRYSESSSTSSAGLSASDADGLILIDHDVLSCLACRFPDRPVHFISFGSDRNESENVRVYMAFDDDRKDYFTIEYGNEVRAVEKFRVVPFDLDGHSFFVPENVDRFLWSWKRSKFVECLNLDMNRTSHEDFQAVALEVSKLRSLAAGYGVTLTLSSGSLLGWYRECSVIPHTHDWDFTINVEEHSPNLIQALEMSSEIGFHYVYSEPSNCFQMKACLEETKLDIFYFYRNDTTGWICGSKGKSRVVWWYPPIAEFCVGDLLGTLVYVPCNVEEHLKVNYGKEWRKEIHSSDFACAENCANIVRRERNEGNSTLPSRFVNRCNGYV
ncbi:hypothetical protein QR680_010974 [Steinernema hermaphroditum]|uniref:Fukutin n=1 Tax=Steinernema hermaphroditum TaxID=289476 RepID=A0AA39IS64_9BILA|nr:hypothetical protein QR680_010974 [Steinernema hermaphroditum]